MSKEQILVGLNKVMNLWETIKDPISGRDLVRMVPLPQEIEDATNQYFFDLCYFGGKFNISLRLCKGIFAGGECLAQLIDGTFDVLQNHVSIRDTLSITNDSTFPLQENHEDGIYFISPYNCSYAKAREEMRLTDFMESVTGFTPGVWFTTILLAYFILFLVSIHLHFNKQSGTVKSFWTLVSFTMKNPIAIDINWTSRTLMLVLALSVFFISTCYFENQIKSDKSTKYMPFVYRSFQDIIDDPDVEIIFRRSTQLKDMFKSAEIGTDMFKVYQKVNRTEGVGTLEARRLLKRDPIPKIVAISDNNDLYNTRIQMCRAMVRDGNHRDTCFYRSWEEDNNSSTQGIMASRSFSRSKLFIEYQKQSRFHFEMGINAKAIMVVHEDTNIIKPSIADCASDSRAPVTYDPELEAFELNNYRYSMLSLLAPFIFAIVALRYEILLDIHEKKKRPWIEVNNYRLRLRPKASYT